MKKLILIIRHAHRDTSKGRARDNGLDLLGWSQARRLTNYYFDTFPLKKPVIFTSPSRRCRETVRGISMRANVRVHVSAQAFEMGGLKKSETHAEFKMRIKRFCKSLERIEKPLILVCSHGDWIPIALNYLTGKSKKLKKGRWQLVSVSRRY